MEPVGIAEIAERLGLSPKTASQWNQRAILPDHRWIVSGSEAWDWDDVKLWAIESGRVQGCVYTEANTGRRHGLVLTRDPETGLVWVEVWLVEQERLLRWIRDELHIRPSGWYGGHGPLIFRVPRREWETRMAAPTVTYPALVARPPFSDLDLRDNEEGWSPQPNDLALVGPTFPMRDLGTR